MSILEETIKAYLEDNLEDIPTLKMLFTPIEELEKRVDNIINKLDKNIFKLEKTNTYMGGGTLPNKVFPSVALHIDGKVNILEKEFRKNNIIGRIEKDKFLLDFRSIMPQDDELVFKIIQEIVE